MSLRGAPFAWIGTNGMTPEAHPGAMTSAAPEARIRLFMDALIAMYQSEVAQLHLLQNGTLAVLGLGTVTYLGGTLPRDAFFGLVGLTASVFAWASHRLDRKQAQFQRDVLRLAEQLERMMRRRGPS